MYVLASFDLANPQGLSLSVGQFFGRRMLLARTWRVRRKKTSMDGAKNLFDGA